MCSAWRFASSQLIPPSPPSANAPRSCCMSVCIMAGSMFMPDSLESCSASMSPPAPPSSCRSSSSNSSSGLRSSSATSAAFQTGPCRAFYASRTHYSHSPARPLTLTPVANDQAGAPVALIDENATTTTSPKQRMSRATVAGIWALTVALVVLFVMTFLPTNYVIQQPGPVYNTLGSATASDGTEVPLITVEGAKTYPTDGTLDLLTVQLA